ncbi:hypothetical protein B4Q04_20120 [Zobellia sp. OII3]|uniref:hypothetical protein n=1 Tax=Zobellia sp. OII3 TaxID=2034520 RepID=UPI000B52D2CE|nr:hypothetical protein [Zobellia sp. OII3]OWW23507.1 hypothetical protein B4Q04_20120 [Zobellia sp. OII3]
MVLENRITLSAHRGFFGLISKEVRGITIDWDDDLEYLKLKVYIEMGASQEVCEDMDIAYTDIIADFDFKRVYDIECVFTDEEISKLTEYRMWYFIRKEDNNSYNVLG